MIRSTLNQFLSTEVLDRVGGCLSTACAIHCSIKPLLLILPSVAWLDVLMSHTTERIMLSAGVLLAMTSVSWGFSRHGCYRVFWLLGAAIAMIVTGRYVLGGIARTMFVVPGGLTIAGTHVLNTVLINQCERCPNHRN